MLSEFVYRTWFQSLSYNLKLAYFKSIHMFYFEHIPSASRIDGQAVLQIIRTNPSQESEVFIGGFTMAILSS